MLFPKISHIPEEFSDFIGRLYPEDCGREQHLFSRSKTLYLPALPESVPAETGKGDWLPALRPQHYATSSHLYWPSLSADRTADPDTERTVPATSG